MRRVLTPSGTIENTFGVSPAVSEAAENNIQRWWDLYTGVPSWASNDVRPLGLPRAICSEFARTVTSELTITVDGGARALYLQQQIDAVMPRLQGALELGLALGGFAIKPYVIGRKLGFDFVSAGAFSPMRFDAGGNCVAAVFRSQPVKVGRNWYVRLEYHDFDGDACTIRNAAFRSDASATISDEVPLTQVPEWSELAPEIAITGVTGPLFGCFANAGSTMQAQIGTSVYAGATEDLLRQADEQWERFLWEFNSAERKIIGTAEAITLPFPGGVQNPLKTDRLFCAMPYDSADFFKEFSPALRHSGYYEGLQAILRRIEFNVGLAYGDLSDPSTVEKTATEVTAARQRKFNAVRSIETSVKFALNAAVYAMDVYATLYDLAPRGKYTLYVDFDDSVLTDADAMRERDRQDVRDGLMQKWEYRVKWYGEDEQTAKSMVSGVSDDPFGFNKGSEI